jgi:hypothetical protein
MLKKEAGLYLLKISANEIPPHTDLQQKMARMHKPV